MRRPIIAGNWKMYKVPSEAVELVSQLKKELKGIKDRDIVVIPPFTSIYPCSKVLENTNIALGAQNMYWEEEGAFTGEVSPLMLIDCGCGYCVIGHSERRTYFHEKDETVNKKIKSALKQGLIPICCIGETLEQREKGETFKIVETQVKKDFEGLTDSQMEKVVIAYEPIWAIGTGRTATPEQANEVHAFIRKTLAGLFYPALAEEVRIQYGGSVKPENCDALMSQPDIDGALVGGASLKAESFSRIVRFKI
ncbi:MAG: triose-phosphate isomerase [bacterium]